jgi:UTP--glucose-1-phosphate uridylyltransferase
MQYFFYLFTRYLSERAHAHELSVYRSFFNRLSNLILTPSFRDWDRIKSPGDDQIVAYNTLPKPKDSSALSKLAVLKVNGGLGTSMGEHSSHLVETFILSPSCLQV